MNSKRAKKLRRIARSICGNDPKKTEIVYKRFKTIKSNKKTK